jgi:hypothetical protein
MMLAGFSIGSGQSMGSGFPQPYDVDRVQETDDLPGRVEFKPFPGEVGVIGTFVMIVLEKLAHHQKVHGQTVFAMVMIVEIGVAVFMSAPVDDGAVDGPHEKMDGQQEEEPPMGCEDNIKSGIGQGKTDAGDPVIADAIDQGPFGIVATEGGLGLFFVEEVVHVNIFRLHRHIPDILEKMRGMRILFGIAVSMVHTVKDGVGAGIEEGGTLDEKGKTIKKPFPEFGHPEHLMGSISMKEKCLGKKRKKPMAQKKN